MAKVTSGSFNTTAYGERYLTFSWSATQNTAKNQSTISWTLKGAGGSTTSYYMSAPFSVTVAGEEVYTSSTRIQLKNGTVVASGTKTITHKEDGTKSFSASVKAAIYAGSYNVSGSNTWDLKDIPRAATITSAPANFTDEENPTIKYSNTLGNSVESLQAAITLNKDGTGVAAAYRNITKTGTSYTFSLTDAERNTLRNNCTTANSRTVYFYIKTVINGVSYTNKIATTLKIVNAIPTYTISIVDTGSKSTVLTGNTSTMIKGYNNMKYTITAQGVKGATIKSYKVTNGGKSLTTATGSFGYTEDNKFSYVITDSRGNSVSNTKTITMINYTKLTAAANMKIALDETDGTKANITVDMNGNYFNGSFGAKSNSLRYDIKVTQVETEKSYTNYETIPTTDMSDGKYNHTYTETQLPYQNSWKIELKIYDEVSSITIPAKILKAQPIFDWGENDFNFNVPITINGIPFQSVVNAMTERYYLPTTISAATNYSAASTSDAILVGNNLRCYFKITRSATLTGNVTNEKICTLTISHGGKLKNMYDGGITTGSAGAVNSYYMSNVKWNTDNTVSFDIYLGATATGYVDMSGMFTVPVVINLNAY